LGAGIRNCVELSCKICLLAYVHTVYTKGDGEGQEKREGEGYGGVEGEGEKRSEREDEGKGEMR